MLDRDLLSVRLYEFEINVSKKKQQYFSKLIRPSYLSLLHACTFGSVEIKHHNHNIYAYGFYILNVFFLIGIMFRHFKHALIRRSTD